VSITITLTIGGQPLQAELDDDALTAIAHALTAKTEPAPDWPEWMDTRGAAKYLGCTVGRIQKLKARGLIRSHSEGKGYRVNFNRHELDADMTKLNDKSRR
jgi:excisionase family DNA binding protein